MPRVVKQAEVRKDEILDVAERLFVTKGYAATTTTDLLEAAGIARGTLYHHFHSKEQVLDGLIRRHGDRVLATMQSVADADGPALTKFVACIASLAPQTDAQVDLVSALSGVGDAALFHKSLDDIVLRLAPVIATVVEQGVTEGVFHTTDPLSDVRILLAAAHALLDNPALAWTPEERNQLTIGLFAASERMLGAQPGSFMQALSATHP